MSVFVCDRILEGVFAGKVGRWRVLVAAVRIDDNRSAVGRHDSDRTCCSFARCRIDNRNIVVLVWITVVSQHVSIDRHVGLGRVDVVFGYWWIVKDNQSDRRNVSASVPVIDRIRNLDAANKVVFWCEGRFAGDRINCQHSCRVSVFVQDRDRTSKWILSVDVGDRWLVFRIGIVSQQVCGSRLILGR